MIVFLTVLYVGVLFLLVKIGILKPRLWVKLSPIAWIFLLLIGLFIPMQFSAPSGQVVVWKPVIPIASRVSGRITKVLVKPLEPVKKGDLLIQIDPEPYQLEVNRLQASLADAKQEVKQLKATWEAAKKSTARAQSQLQFQETEYRRNVTLLSKRAASEEDVERSLRNRDTAQATLAEMKALEVKAQLAYDSEITEGPYKGQNTKVAQIEAALAKAEYDLRQTKIIAPEDGYVVNLQLQEGMSMAIFAGNPMLTFVPSRPEEAKYVVAQIPENFLRHVKAGNEVELSMRFAPGTIIRGKVDHVIQITGEGQLLPSGKVPEFGKTVTTDGQFAVKIKLNDDVKLDLPIGGGGQAAIYTKSGKATHVIRRVMMRMNTWLNYIF